MRRPQYNSRPQPSFEEELYHKGKEILNMHTACVRMDADLLTKEGQIIAHYQDKSETLGETDGHLERILEIAREKVAHYA